MTTAILASNERYLIGGTNFGHRCYFTRSMYEAECADNRSRFVEAVFVKSVAEQPSLTFEEDELYGLEVTCAFDPQSETWYVLAEDIPHTR